MASTFQNPAVDIIDTRFKVLNEHLSSVVTTSRESRIRKQLKDENERKNLNLRKMKITDQTAELDYSISALPTYEGMDIDDTSKALFEKELQRVKNLGVYAMETGDPNDYDAYVKSRGDLTKASKQFEQVIRSWGGFEKERWENSQELNKLNDRSITGNTLDGANDNGRMLMAGDIFGAGLQKTVPSFINGKLVFSYAYKDGEEDKLHVLDVGDYLAGLTDKKNPKGMIEYVEDPSKVVDYFWNTYKDKYSNSVSQTQRRSTDKTKIYNVTNYDESNADLITNIRDDKNLNAFLNNQLWQSIQTPELLESLTDDEIQLYDNDGDPMNGLKSWDAENKKMVAFLKQKFAENVRTRYGRENKTVPRATGYEEKPYQVDPSTELVVDQLNLTKDYFGGSDVISSDKIGDAAQNLNDQSSIEKGIKHITFGELGGGYLNAALQNPENNFGGVYNDILSGYDGKNKEEQLAARQKFNKLLKENLGMNASRYEKLNPKNMIFSGSGELDKYKLLPVAILTNPEKFNDYALKLAGVKIDPKAKQTYKRDIIYQTKEIERLKKLASE